MKSATNNWQKFNRLSASERLLFAQAFVMLRVTTLALRAVGLRRWQSVLRGLAPAAVTPEDHPISHERQSQVTARLVRVAADHGPLPANCLSRSLVLWWLLRRQGVEGSLRIGTRKGAAGFEAHAWVEAFGVALNESDDVGLRFKAFDCSIESAGAESG